MKATYLSKLMVASILLLGMFLLPSCGDSENTTEEPGTEINGEENDTIAVNFDHQVTQPAPGGDTPDGGPQAVSRITSVAGVPLVRLNNGVMMPRLGLALKCKAWKEPTSGRNLTRRFAAWSSQHFSRGIVIWTMPCFTIMSVASVGE